MRIFQSLFFTILLLALLHVSHAANKHSSSTKATSNKEHITAASKELSPKEQQQLKRTASKIQKRKKKTDQHVAASAHITKIGSVETSAHLGKIYTFDHSTMHQAIATQEDQASKDLAQAKVKKAAAVSADESPTFPGVEFLGVGYDLIFGNPSGDPITQIDPGFRAPVVKRIYEDADSGAKYAASYGYPETSCYQSSSAVSQNSMSDYQSSLSVEASVSGGADFGLASCSFSASYASHQFQRDVVDSESERYILTSYCLQYYTSFFEGDATKQVPTDHLLIEAQQLPLLKKDQKVTAVETVKWNRFFNEFGTHFISGLHLGGKLVHQVTYSRESVQAMRQNGMSVKASVEASYGPAHISASTSVDKNSESTTSRGSSSEDAKTFVFGGIPPAMDMHSKEAFGSWAATVSSAPMPVRYEITPMSDLECIDTYTYGIMLAEYGKSNAPSDETLGKTVGGSSGGRDSLFPGKELGEGQSLYNQDKTVRLTMQEDGNMVIYATVNNEPLWDSNTYKCWFVSDEATTYALRHEGDGNLCVHARNTQIQEDGSVVKNDDGTPVIEDHTCWCYRGEPYTRTNCKEDLPGMAKLDSSGNFIVTNMAGERWWQTETTKQSDKGIWMPAKSNFRRVGKFNRNLCQTSQKIQMCDHPNFNGCKDVGIGEYSDMGRAGLRHDSISSFHITSWDRNYPDELYLQAWHNENYDGTFGEYWWDEGALQGSWNDQIDSFKVLYRDQR